MERALSTRSNDWEYQHGHIRVGSEPGIQVQAFTDGTGLSRIKLYPAEAFIFDATHCGKEFLEVFLEWLDAYSKGIFLKLPIPLPKKGFRRDVVTALLSIPWGKVASYKEIAEKIDNPRAARAVGNICCSNPFPLIIPCHRVIRSNGKLGNYTPHISLKTRLLQFERFL